MSAEAAGAGSPRRWAWAALGLAALTWLPFAHDLARGRSFCYRDLGRTFLPARLYALEGLAAGQLRYWNPYLHEGEPTAPLPLSYPPDLLQLLVPSNWGISLSLALHVPLAALAFAWLARSLGHRPAAAFAGAVVYAWGGFLLSTLNLYYYLHAAAWAPLVVWACRRALAARGWARLAPVGIFAVAVSTQGAELLLQAFALGFCLAPARERAAGRRLMLSLALGFGLCGYVILPLLGMTQGSVRAQGFSAEQVMGFSLHPFSLLQTFVANLHSDLADVANHFWGRRYFPGQAYLHSLYLGPLALVLAARGLRQPNGRLLGLLATLAALLSLGQYGGLQPLAEWLPLRIVRFPVKAFFLTHFCVALLATMGLERLAAERRAWRAAALGWLAFAVVLGIGGAGLLTREDVRRVIVGVVLAPLAAAWLRLDIGQRMGADALQAGLLCLGAALLAVAAARARLPLRWAVLVLTGLLAADLLRAGSGLNTFVPSTDLSPSAESVALGAQLSRRQARVLVCDVDWAAFLRTNATPSFEWRLRAYTDLLIPARNVDQQVRSVLAANAAMLVPDSVCLTEWELLCRDVAGLRERLAQAAATHVVATRPLEVPGLRLESVARPARIAPLQIFVYAREQARPFADLGDAGSADIESQSPGHMVLRAKALRSGELVVHERWARGWQARLNGQFVPLLQGRRHLTVALPAGEQRVELSYEPPGLRAGLAVSLFSLALLGLAVRLDLRRPRSAV